MSNATLHQLQRRHTRPYLTLSELRAAHFPHIQTDRHLRRIFRAEFDVSPIEYAQTQRLLLANLDMQQQNHQTTKYTDQDENQA